MSSALPQVLRRATNLSAATDRAPQADVVHQVAVPTPEYLTLEDLAVYSGMSRSALKRLLRDPEDPLPRASLPREKVRVRRSEFDRWYVRRRPHHEARAAGLQHERDAEVERIADQFFARLRRLPHHP